MDILIKVIIGTISIAAFFYVISRSMMSIVNNKIERGFINIEGSDFYIGNRKKEEILAKGLNIYPDANGAVELVSEEPDEKTILDTIDSMDWNYICFVILAYSENHSIEVSGSLQDGFCSIYKIQDEELFAHPPPNSIIEMKELLTTFLVDKPIGLKKYGFL